MQKMTTTLVRRLEDMRSKKRLKELDLFNFEKAMVKDYCCLQLANGA